MKRSEIRSKLNFEKALIVLFVLVGFSFGRLSESKAKIAEVSVPLRVFWFDKSNWSEAKVREQLNQAQAVYSKCNVKLDPLSIVRVKDVSSELRKELIDQAKKENAPTLLEAAIEADRQSGVGDDQRGPTALRIFFFDGFVERENSTPFSIGPKNSVKYDPFLYSSVWMTSTVLTETYLRDHGRYNVLAHELAHVLLNDPEHNNYAEGDLMTVWRSRNNNILPYCAKIRFSPLANWETSGKEQNDLKLSLEPFSRLNSNHDDVQIVNPEVLHQDFIDLQPNLNKIWLYIRDHLISPTPITPPPYIYFASFSEDSQDPSWNEWQRIWIESSPTIWKDWFCDNSWSALERKECEIRITPLWIGRLIEEKVFPFSSHSTSFHYQGTNRIQINDRLTFYARFERGPDGVRKDLIGAGYYAAAREMLNYYLEQRGIKSPHLRRCLFVSDRLSAPPLMSQVTDYLTEAFATAQVRQWNYLPEVSLSPCSRLSEEELAALEKLRDL